LAGCGEAGAPDGAAEFLADVAVAEAASDRVAEHRVVGALKLEASQCSRSSFPIEGARTTSRLLAAVLSGAYSRRLPCQLPVDVDDGLVVVDVGPGEAERFVMRRPV
jgi:hypothetical protein